MADRFAGLRASPTTPNADTRILSAALHTLIAAIFARIFTRLEQILRLWQSGDLPELSHHTPAKQPRAPSRHKSTTRAQSSPPPDKNRPAQRHLAPVFRPGSSSRASAPAQ